VAGQNDWRGKKVTGQETFLATISLFEANSLQHSFTRVNINLSLALVICGEPKTVK
jgi:hypothetical protein